MRIERLELRAFGPFTGEVLDLSAPAPALHLVHGRNEAGKSTTRRALEGLLYGIPERTPDAHLHAPSKLRVGGVLLAADGQRLHVVRRKGRKNTLLDEDEQPLDDGQLDALLRGVSRERFRATFALGHDTLRAGAEDLERALGDVGESLFDAGLGGQGVHRVLASLREECDALWAPRATTKPLAKAIAEFRDAQSAQRKGMLSESALREQRKGLRELREREAALRARRKAMREQIARLNHAREVLPSLARRQTLQAERAALGHAPRLPADAATRRQEALDNRNDARNREARAAADLAKLGDKLAALRVHDALLSVPESVIDDVDEQLGRHRSAVADRPKRDRDLRNADREVSDMLARLGRDLAPEQAEALVADERLTERVNALSEERGRVTKDREHAERRLVELRAQEADLEARAEAPADDVDGARFDRALAPVRALGDPAARREQLEEAVARALAARESAWRALSPRPDRELLERADVLPDAEVVATFAAQRAQLDERARRLDERTTEARAALRRATRELQAEREAGELPAPDALGEARARRDARWQAVRDGADPKGPEGAGLERETREADALADRLRHEAARVERAGRLAVEVASAEQVLAELTSEAAALADERDAHDAAWRALWEPSGLEPGEPSRRGEWLATWARVVERHAEHAAAVEALGAYDARVARACAQLRDVVEPDPRHEHASHVEALLADAARVESLRAERAERERAALRAAEELVQVRANRAAAEAEQARAEAEHARWSAAWADAMAALDLPDGASGPEAHAVLARHAELAKLLERRTSLVGRLAGMDRDAEAFEASVLELVRRAGEQPDGRTVEERAQELTARYRQARADARRRDELRADIERAEDDLHVARLDATDAQARLDELMRAAGVDDEAALPEAERLSAEADRLDERLADLDEQLAQVGEGTAIDELHERYAGLTTDRARAESEDLETELSALDEELDEVRRDLGSLESGLDEQQGDRAADLAQQAQGHLVRVRELARRWATRRLATVLLEREIERYREQHQGPVLSRASELFPRLTESRYSGLRADVDDHDGPVLQCVRADGERLDVAALSDGTRDQLYLALRVASLERQAAHDEPFPLVVDDVLVHFDDTRTRLALEVLGELAATTQVIVFTHHERVVELAREALPGDRLVELALDSLARP